MKNKSTTIKPGFVWSRHSFGSVIKTTAQAVTVQNEVGKEWEVGLDLFKDEFEVVGFESDHTETVKLSQTELSQKFLDLPRQVVSVNFNKKVEDKETLGLVQAAWVRSKVAFDIKVKEILKDLLTGEERTMRGYHYGTRDGFGRIHFTELATYPTGGLSERAPTEGQYDKRHRLVDPRTINWFISEGIRYQVKS